ncbi:MAG: nucleotidyltransferase domain-containing protein [Candidatus Micrarchaeota archaeon]|nr:nucleotidyltransferase domain-containing protein [Candidatus Micrarchaeota archaeon]
MTKIAQIENIAKNLKTIKGIKIAILFGSQAKGRARNDSDTDICIIGDSKKSELRALEYSSEKIDILPFAKLPLVFQYKVLKYGKILFNRDERLLTRTKFWTITKYLNGKYWRDKFTAKVLSC